MTKTRSLDPRTAVFAAFATTMLLVEWCVSRSAAFTRAAPVPLAVFVDCVLVLPLAFALLVLRPAKRSLLQAVPVLALGALVAGWLLRGRSETHVLMQVVGAVVELAVLGLLVRRVRTANRELHASTADDLLLRVGALTDPMLRVLGLELAVVYYGLAGWRVRRDPRPGDFGYLETTGVGGLLFALGLVVAFEGFGVHFLLHAWSVRLAWVHAALDVYALVWLAAAFQAARLRPVMLSSHTLLVRTSLLWTVSIPRAAITGVTRIQEMPVVNGKRDTTVLRAAFGTSPSILVTLAEPVVAYGLLGVKKSVRAIALYVDDADTLAKALTPHVSDTQSLTHPGSVSTF
jgi:hypothetical protein